MYTYIDLFAGPGGLCTGFKNEGFKPLIAVEMSDNTVKTYAKNHDAEIYLLSDLLDNVGTLENILNLENYNTVLIHGDIRLVTDELIVGILKKKFNTEKVDIVAGGPPCESFSMAGKRLDGDDRDNLFENMLRIAKAADSKYIFFENVPGLLTKKTKGEKVFNFVVKEFENKGFTLASKDEKVIKCLAADYGVPQKRARVFLVASNNKYGENKFIYPEKTHGENAEFKHITVEEALKYLSTLESGEGEDKQGIEYSYEEEFLDGKINKGVYEYYKFISGKEGYKPTNFKEIECVESIYNHKAVNHTKKVVKRFSYIKEGEGMRKAAERLIAEGNEETRNLYFPNKLYEARNRRLKADAPSFTVTSHCLDEMIHYKSDRGLTPRETARLQSFPDWYNFEGGYVIFHGDPLQDKYEQCGDAIPVLLVKALARELKKALDNGEYN